MGQDATMTDKLLAEKKKLEIQMEAAKKRTAMLRAEYQAMSRTQVQPPNNSIKCTGSCLMQNVLKLLLIMQ